MCVNGQYGDKEIKDRRVVKQSTCDKSKLYESQKWYFYPVEQTYDKTIVTETEYTDKGFVSKSIDERNNETSYTYNEDKGTLTNVTNANDVTTEYEYDANNNSLLSVSSSGVTNSYDYSKARLQNINVNGALQYKFDYDKFGRTTANKVGNGTNWKTLSEMDYNTAGLLAKQTYGNGDYVDFSYDSFDRQTEKRYNGDNNQRVTYSYGNNGSVAQITDYFTNSNTRFTYDLAERVVSQREYSGTAKNGGNLLSYTDFTYADKTNYLTGIKHFSPLGTQTIGYTFGVQKDGEMPDQVYKVTWNGADKVTYKYDNLGRLESKHIGAFDTNFTYEDVTVNNDQRTTTLVKSVTTPTGTLTYTYDKLGNILSVTDGTYTTSYEYDSLNQLTRINDEKAGKTTTYSYTNGNITECNEYAYTTAELNVPLSTKTWTYDDSTWSDLLTNYNGTPITYDEIGNPLTIGSKSLTWTGRQLQGWEDEENSVSYSYNGDGLRTSKTVNDVTTEYYYNGSILAGQKSGDDTLVFMYDNNSDIFGFIYNDTEYYYIKNAQNDVIAIADADGNVLVKYTYDAWGKVIAVTDKDGNPINNITDENASNDIDESVGNGVLDVPSNADETTTVNETATVDESVSLTTVDPQIAQIAHINPILYRSYYYDKETEWYYLKSRYYSPDMCRFINADGIIGANQDILAYNMFAYCSNDPINNCDSNGQGKLRNWLKKGLNKIKNYINRTFGFSLTLSKTKKRERTITKNHLMSIKKGIEVSRIYNKGSSKPITAYINCELSDIYSSTYGIKINISKLTLEFSGGFDNIGRTISWNEGNFTYSDTKKINASEMSIVFGTSLTRNWDYHSASYYNEMSIYIEPIFEAFAYAYAYNEYSTTPYPYQPKPQPQPRGPYVNPFPRFAPASCIHLIIIEVKL